MLAAEEVDVSPNATTRCDRPDRRVTETSVLGEDDALVRDRLLVLADFFGVS